jgi:hypothetical protein
VDALAKLNGYAKAQNEIVNDEADLAVIGEELDGAQTETSDSLASVIEDFSEESPETFSTYLSDTISDVAEDLNASTTEEEVRDAAEPHILFLNPDCVLSANAVEHMLEVLKKNPEAGIAGGRLINADGTEQEGGRRAVPTPWRAFVRAFGLYRFHRHWPRLFYDFHLHKQPLPSTPVEVEAISGALMLAKAPRNFPMGVRAAETRTGWRDVSDIYVEGNL